MGCDEGYFAREMAHRGARVIGIDISPRMVENAQQQEAMTPLGIEYRIADTAALDTLIGKGSFDAATSCVALQDMPEVAQVLRAVHARGSVQFLNSKSEVNHESLYYSFDRDRTSDYRRSGGHS